MNIKDTTNQPVVNSTCEIIWGTNPDPLQILSERTVQTIIPSEPWYFKDYQDQDFLLHQFDGDYPFFNWQIIEKEITQGEVTIEQATRLY